ncbi:MAG TPA: hypothetical protein VKZ51_07895 [Cyclobacteriaceae bacterium]|nr:hypothetical protein [Cyclobacteriaceae bacterium]
MKEKRGTREHRISFRLNDEELEFLNGFSKSTGIYRSYVLRNLIKKIRTDVSIIKTDQLLKVLASLAAEQGRVNNNINQLAKHANQLSMEGVINPKIFLQFNVLLSKYLEYQDEMNKTFKKIYKTIS